MKKRLLSALLAAVMLLLACPAISFSVAAEPEEYEAEDYDALYVTSGLQLAVDFFKTNEYWGEEAVNATSNLMATLNAFITFKAKSNIAFGGSGNTAVKIENGAFVMDSSIHTLSISGVDAAMDYGYSGSTVQMLSSATAEDTESKRFDIVINNTRYVMQKVGGELRLAEITLGDIGEPSAVLEAAPLYNDAAVVFTQGSIKTLTYTMTRPWDTREIYPYNYSVSKAVKPTASQTTDAVSDTWQAFFYVTHTGDANGVTPLAKAVSYTHASYEPVYVTVDGAKYIVGAINRGNENVGPNGTAYWNGTPGTIGIYENGEQIYYNDALRFPDNTALRTVNYWRLSNQGARRTVYAARYYNRNLTSAEMAQNHFADLAKWFRLDLSKYLTLSEGDRAKVHEVFADYTIFSDRDALAAAYDAKLNALLYDVLLEGLEAGSVQYTEADTFVEIAKEYNLSVSTVKLFPASYRRLIFRAVNNFGGVKTQENLQSIINEQIAYVLELYYSQYIEDTDFNYRDLYVHQDKLVLAVDFFAARPEDGNVYTGKEYVFNGSTLSETITHPNEWSTLTDTYLWKGRADNFKPVDLGTGIAHTNVRTYGDGRLICTTNNSILLKYANDDYDATYQVVSKVTGAPEWQLRGFRAGLSGGDGSTFRVAWLSHQGYGVSASGVPNPKMLLSVYPSRDVSPEISAKYSTDITASITRRVGSDKGHYYKYTYNEAKGTYDVVEVATKAEANSSFITYRGRMDIDFYANAKRVYGLEDVSYDFEDIDTIGNWGANEYFAIRVYSCALNAEEIAQNHFADLVGYAGLDLRVYYRLAPEVRAIVHDALTGVQLGAPREEIDAAYRAAIAEVYYDFDSNTAARNAFCEFAAKYALNVDSMRELSPIAQERLFTMMSTTEYVGTTWLEPVLQENFENTVAYIKSEHYGESVVHTVSSYVGLQLKASGAEPGMRALFSLDTAAISRIVGAYSGNTKITVGMMLLPMASASAAITVEGDSIVLPSQKISSVVAYENGNYTDEVFRLDGQRLFACEYFPTNYNTKIAFVGYVVIQCEGEEPIVYQMRVRPDFQRGEGFSLMDLTRHAKENLGLAYENVQKLMNANSQKDYEDLVVTLGGANVGEYVIVATEANADVVKELQDMLYEYVGIRLTVVTPDQADLYTKKIVIGESCDIVHRDKTLYGLTQRGTVLNLWYQRSTNAAATLSLLRDHMILSRNGSGVLEIAGGTDIIRRAR